MAQSQTTTLQQISAPSQFQRGCHKDSLVLPTSAANAIVFPFHCFSGGRLIVDGAGGGTVTWYETDDPETAVVAAKKADGTAITNALGGAGGFEIPPELFGCAFIAPVINSGTVNAKLILKK